MRSLESKIAELAAAQCVDQACERFEAAWESGPRPRIEAYLAEVHDSAKPILVEELIALEVELRRSAGEEPTVNEYLARFPDQATRIDALFRNTPPASPPPPTSEFSSREAEGATPDHTPRGPTTVTGDPPPSDSSRYRPVRL